MEIKLKGVKSSTNPGIELIRSLVHHGEFNRALREVKKIEKNLETELKSEERGDISHLASICLYHLGRYKEALSKAGFAFEIFKDTSENQKVAQIQDILGRIHWGLGDLGNAEVYLRDAITTYRRIRDYGAVIRCTNIIARILFTRSQFEKAVEYLNQARELSRSIKDSLMEAKISGNLGRVHTLLGEWESAEQELGVSLRATRRKGDEIGMCRDLLSLGYLFALRRKFHRATQNLSAAFQLAQKNNYLRETVIYHEYMGEICFAQGNIMRRRSIMPVSSACGRALRQTET